MIQSNRLSASLKLRGFRVGTKFGTAVALNAVAMNDLSYRRAVTDFKRQLIAAALQKHGGNRTHAARALGLQRTYLLRLIRDLGADIAPRSLPNTEPR
jgi:DNA-binding NtrC family response regulator